MFRNKLTKNIDECVIVPWTMEHETVQLGARKIFFF